MGTPWGCPTTGVTPSARKHGVSSQGRRRAGGGLAERAGTGDTTWGGGNAPPAPPSLILWARNSAHVTRSSEQSQAVSGESCSSWPCPGTACQPGG